MLFFFFLQKEGTTSRTFAHGSFWTAKTIDFNELQVESKLFKGIVAAVQKLKLLFIVGKKKRVETT